MTSVSKEVTLVVLLIQMMCCLLKTECCNSTPPFFAFSWCWLYTKPVQNLFQQSIALGWRVELHRQFCLLLFGMVQLSPRNPCCRFLLSLCIMSKWSHAYKEKSNNLLCAFCWFSERNPLSIETQLPYLASREQHKTMRVGAGPPLPQYRQGHIIRETQTFAAPGLRAVHHLHFVSW